MSLKSFLRLCVLEIEEYWRFPIFELVLFTAVLILLNYETILSTTSLDYNTPILLVLIVGVVVPRSFAGSINSGETTVLLSYPVKRGSLFAAKFLVNFLLIFALFAFADSLYIPLIASGLQQPLVNTLMLFVQILFLCATATAVSFLIKNETISAFAFILTFLGLEFSLTSAPPPYKYFTLEMGSSVIRTYPGLYTFQDFAVALILPLVLSGILLLATFVYFRWIMQID